jgi:hypothetical protein
MDSQEAMVDLHFVRPTSAIDLITTSQTQHVAIVIALSSEADFASTFLASGLAIRLVRAGAALFALVGNESEQSHDALDWALEEYGAMEVVTSWHTENDLEDVADFVIASCRASDLGQLIVIVNGSNGLGYRLKEHMSDAVQADTST